MASKPTAATAQASRCRAAEDIARCWEGMAGPEAVVPDLLEFHAQSTGHHTQAGQRWDWRFIQRHATTPSRRGVLVRRAARWPAITTRQ